MNIKRKVSYCFLLALQARSKHLHELLKHIKKQNYTVHFDLSASVRLEWTNTCIITLQYSETTVIAKMPRGSGILPIVVIWYFLTELFIFCAIHLHSILCFEYTASRSPVTKQAFHIKSVLLRTTIDSSKCSIFVSDQLRQYIFLKVRMTLLQNNID